MIHLNALLDDALRLHRAVDSLIAGTLAPVAGTPPTANGTGPATVWELPVDVYATDDGAVLVADVPGVDPADLDVTVDREAVTIAGKIPALAPVDEMKDATWYLTELSGGWTGSFRRVISLPFPIDAGKAEASLAHGRLTIRLPRTEATKPVRLSVTGDHALAIGDGQGAPAATAPPASASAAA